MNVYLSFVLLVELWDTLKRIVKMLPKKNKHESLGVEFNLKSDSYEGVNERAGRGD